MKKKNQSIFEEACPLTSCRCTFVKLEGVLKSFLVWYRDFKSVPLHDVIFVVVVVIFFFGYGIGIIVN